MGQLVTVLKTYFCVVTKYHRAVSDLARGHIFRNDVALLNSRETNPNIRRRLTDLIQKDQSCPSSISRSIPQI